MNIHNKNIKAGNILADGNSRFYVLEVDRGRDGSTIVRGVYHAPARNEEPTATQIFRLDEKADLVGNYV